MNTRDKKTKLLELLSQTNDSSLIDEVYEMLHPESAVENINLQSLLPAAGAGFQHLECLLHWLE